MIVIDTDRPKESDEFIELVIFGDGRVLQTGESWRNLTDKRCYYTTTTPEKRFHATQLPKHGRLIDADALRQTMYHEAFETDSPMQKWDSGCWIRYKMFERMEKAAPTIIPASKEETCTKDL